MPTFELVNESFWVQTEVAPGGVPITILKFGFNYVFNAFRVPLATGTSRTSVVLSEIPMEPYTITSATGAAGYDAVVVGWDLDTSKLEAYEADGELTVLIPDRFDIHYLVLFMESRVMRKSC